MVFELEVQVSQAGITGVCQHTQCIVVLGLTLEFPACQADALLTEPVSTAAGLPFRMARSVTERSWSVGLADRHCLHELSEGEAENRLL